MLLSFLKFLLCRRNWGIHFPNHISFDFAYQSCCPYFSVFCPQNSKWLYFFSSGEDFGTFSNSYYKEKLFRCVILGILGWIVQRFFRFNYIVDWSIPPSQQWICLAMFLLKYRIAGWKSVLDYLICKPALASESLWILV